MIADVREKAAPVLADARDKAVPVIAAGAATVAAKATDVKQRAEGKAAQLTGQQPKKRSKLKMLLLFGGIAGVVAVVARKLQGGTSSSGGSGWQSSYTPTPPPVATEPTDESSTGAGTESADPTGLGTEGIPPAADTVTPPTQPVIDPVEQDSNPNG
jgi:hypothetical protein